MTNEPEPTEDPTPAVEEVQRPARLIPHTTGKRIATKVFHAYDDCVRLDGATNLIDADDQVIDLLNLKECATCIARAQTDPEPIVGVVFDTMGYPDFNVRELFSLLDTNGFEVRPKRKPPTKKPAAKK